VSGTRSERLALHRSAQRASRAHGADWFSELVGQALDSLPSPFREKVHNLAVVVEDDPSPATLRQMGLRHGETLLGLYQGVPLHRRSGEYNLVTPDRITLYRRPILERCRDDRAVVREVRATVLHELGHYFGLSDAELK
jgi:predicted Zn-dependent protease with MMP-like domain